jgi:DNA-binding CsgD family transcriptional regulator
MSDATYDATVEAIYRAAGQMVGWKPALEQIADYVGGAGAMLSYNDLQNGGGFIETGRLREDLEQLYLSNYVRNPWNLAMAAQGPRARPFTTGSLIDRGILHRTGFYADILAPQKLSDQIVLNHPAFSHNGGIGGFGVVLTSGQIDDSAAALDRMNRLTPHLARALDLSVDLERHRQEAYRLGSLLQALPMPALLLDYRGRIFNTNPGAERMLRAQDSIRVKPGMLLAAAIPHEAPALRSAIARALAVAAGGKDGFRYALSLQRRSGLPPHLVLVTPLPAPSSRIFEIADPRTSLLIKIIDPADGGEGSAGALREAYGLTAAEARVAGLVADGLSTPEIAVALGVSASTVRTHLAACYDKTGLRSQVTLARLVGMMVPEAAAIRRNDHG